MPVSPNIAGRCCAFAGLTLEKGSMKWSRPPTFAIGSYTVTPMQDPRA
jgi:hypothetical protein